MLDFLPLGLNDRERYSALYAVCPERSGQYAFFALWGWNETDPAKLAYAYDLCWIECHGHRSGLLAPVGDWDKTDWQAVFEHALPPVFNLIDVPEALLERFPENLKRGLVIEELRDEWEYVHSISELVALKGNRYAQKRAHVKAFTGNYSWEYCPLLPEDFQDLLAFQAEWCARRDCKEAPALYAEDRAVRRALEMWDLLPLLGAMLKIDGTPVAYAIAEEIAPDTLDIRFEKAFSEYAGIYQALNKLFLERQGQGYLWVNREEDMGNPGLRDAKLSYHPVRFIKKYKVSSSGGFPRR